MRLLSSDFVSVRISCQIRTFVFRAEDLCDLPFYVYCKKYHVSINTRVRSINEFLKRKKEVTKKLGYFHKEFKYNVIGDIHGSDRWKQLVMPDAVNIFVGDYFDPKYDFPDDHDPTSANPDRYCEGSAEFAHIRNFLEIIRYKQDHPETVLLLGNHDLHYLIPERYSHYDSQLAPTFYHLLQAFRPLFHGVAYSVENKALVTHAGVSKKWYEKFFSMEDISPDVVARNINHLAGMDRRSKRAPQFDTDKLCTFFGAAQCLDPEDNSGNSPAASPLWIRPEMLKSFGLYNDVPRVLQVVGHTPCEGLQKADRIIFVDCLRFRPASLLLKRAYYLLSYAMHTPD